MFLYFYSKSPSLVLALSYIFQGKFIPSSDALQQCLKLCANALTRTRSLFPAALQLCPRARAGPTLKLCNCAHAHTHFQTWRCAAVPTRTRRPNPQAVQLSPRAHPLPDLALCNCARPGAVQLSQCAREALTDTIALQNQ